MLAHKFLIKEQFSPPGNNHRSKREQCALGLLHQKGQHHYLWGRTEMMETLKEIGYTNVKLYPYQESGVPDFKNIDTPGKIRAGACVALLRYLVRLIALCKLMVTVTEISV